MPSEPVARAHINTLPRLAVVGPGALGTLVAGRLAQSGLPTLLFDYRLERALALHEGGVTLQHTDGAAQHLTLHVTADPGNLVQIDAVIVLVKAFCTEEVAVTLATHLAPHAIVLTLQNGLGNIETLQLHLGEARVFGGTTAQGAILEAPGVVRDTGSGPFVLGNPAGTADPRLDDLAQALLLAGFSVSITHDLPAALWTKAILNAAINPVAALTHLRNGALVEHEPSLALMTAAAREAARIATRHGVRLTVKDWKARLLTICRATSMNINSMLQDVLRQRPTEVDAINGAIVRTAERNRMQAPVNRSLWYLLRTLEHTYPRQHR